MKYRKGDIFRHIKKGTIAVITKVNDDGTFNFVTSNPADIKDTWTPYKNESMEQIDDAINGGFMLLYRPSVSNFKDELFEL